MTHGLSWFRPQKADFIPGYDSCTLSYAFAPTTQDFASQALTVQSDAAGDTGFALQGSDDALFVSAFEP